MARFAAGEQLLKTFANVVPSHVDWGGADMRLWMWVATTLVISSPAVAAVSDIAKAGAWDAFGGTAEDGTPVCGVSTGWGDGRALLIKIYGSDPGFTVQLLKSTGTVRNFVCGAGFTDQAWALVKRSPKRMANWALAIVHSRGGMIHSFSARCKTRNNSLMAASSVGEMAPCSYGAAAVWNSKASMEFVV